VRIRAVRSGRFVLTLAGAALLFLLVASCRQRGAEDFAASLPELPKDLDATLDPRTLATKVSTAHPAPEKLTGVVLAACCGSSDTKTLKVTFPYTKCGPLRDFILAPVGDLVLFDTAQGGGREKTAAPSNFKVFRRGEVNRRTVLDTIVCVAGQGPWNATLIEDRNCNGYSPYDSLFVNAFGDAISFYWSGGPSNHPADVHLVSCRKVGLFKFSCGGLSTCSCDSSPCAADLPCDCGLEGQW